MLGFLGPTCHQNNDPNSVHKFMPAAQWSSPGDEPVLAHNGGQKRPKGHLEESTTSGRLWKRHSCLHFKCRALARLRERRVNLLRIDSQLLKCFLHLACIQCAVARET